MSSGLNLQAELAKGGNGAFGAMTGAQRAAALLLLLGESEGAPIWQMLDEDEVKLVSHAMVQLGSLEAETVEKLIVDRVPNLVEYDGWMAIDAHETALAEDHRLDVRLERRDMDVAGRQRGDVARLADAAAARDEARRQGVEALEEEAGQGQRAGPCVGHGHPVVGREGGVHVGHVDGEAGDVAQVHAAAGEQVLDVGHRERHLRAHVADVQDLPVGVDRPLTGDGE